MDNEGRPFVSVKFDPVGRSRQFLLSGVEFEPPLAPGDPVIVQRGEQRSYATVTRTVPQTAARRAPGAKSADKVVRRATQQDITARLRHQHREREAQRVAVMKIKERNLPMKLVRVEQLFDSPRLVFYFTAEGRVDFRELVRELALVFRCRIEMRQVGARDEARLVGGYGTCGRPLCCTTWLPGFAPVSNQDGEAAEPQPEPLAAVGALRSPEVLSAIRAAERRRRAVRRLLARGIVQSQRRRVRKRGLRRRRVPRVRHRRLTGRPSLLPRSPRRPVAR